MAAAKKPAGAKSSAKSNAKKGAASAAKPASKTSVRSVARKATTQAAKGVVAGGEKLGRGTRWTEEQVALLLDTVKASPTAKEGFEAVAKQLGKSAGTVQQKYYNLQRQGGGGAPRRRGRPRSQGTGTRIGGASLPTATQLRALDVDDLVGLATLVKGEIDRRRTELDAAAQQLADLAG
ncbi:MAG: hypothetical protein ABI200_07685 [Gaiellales bacterium]